MKVSIKISARHVHLTEDAIDTLFGHPLTVRNYLNQKGQYASGETVTIKTEKGSFEGVRVVGPERRYNQVEISKGDARKLGINPPVRKSGDLSGASLITIETEKGCVTGNFAIIAERHVHFNTSDAEKLEIKDGDVLNLSLGKEKKGIIEVKAKVSDDGYFEVHLDTDDANAFLLDSEEEGLLNEMENR